MVDDFYLKKTERIEVLVVDYKLTIPKGYHFE